MRIRCAWKEQGKNTEAGIHSENTKSTRKSRNYKHGP